jgi:hypothetical protein
MYGLQCYAARPEGLLERVEQLERLAWEPPAEGGGSGIDGALCELSWRQPDLLRLAPPRSLFHTLPGCTAACAPRPWSPGRRSSCVPRPIAAETTTRRPPTRV